MRTNGSDCLFRGWVRFAFSSIYIFALTGSVIAQTVCSGTTIHIRPGTTAVSKGTLKISPGAHLDNRGKIILRKNLDNRNSAQDDLGKGTVVFAGNTAQNISGKNILQDVQINNPAGVNGEGDTRITGNLKMTAGRFILGKNNLTLGTSASVSGTPSASAMIVTNGTGELRKEFAAPGVFTFPTGDLKGTADYSPVTLQLMSGNFLNGNYVAVHVTDDKYSGLGSSSNYISRFWSLRQNNIGNFSCNAVFQYTVEDITGPEQFLSCVRADTLPWQVFGQADTAGNKLIASGIRSSGVFTGAAAGTEKSANLHLYLESLYDGNGLMHKAQDEYGDHFPGDIADQVTIELHDPSFYSTILYSSGAVNLTTGGHVTVTRIPATLSGSYYITVKNRNCIETVSSVPVSFAGSQVSYDFTKAVTQAFGDNLLGVNGVFVIFGADINQDGIVDGGDRNLVENAMTQMSFGYIPEDANGDGIVDSSDLNVVDNNATNVVMAITP